jgi:sn-glycerol 3-phosphate transport system substrate-binding protein
MESSGVYTKSPALKTAVNQMNAGKTTPNSQGLRLGNYGSIRDAIEEQMENVFAGKKTAKQGLDDAVAKSDDVLKEFAATYK